jgi:hypothetical protein
MADFDARPLLVTETASVWDVAFKHSYGQTPLQFQRDAASAEAFHLGIGC